MSVGALLVWLFTLGMAVVFLVAWIRALSELGKVERERDSLWDELYGVTCRGDEDCIAGYGHEGAHRYPSWHSMAWSMLTSAQKARMMVEDPESYFRKARAARAADDLEEWLDYDPVSRATNAVIRAEESLERLNAIRRQQRVRMQPLSRAEKWRAIWWGFTHPFADPRKVRTDR